MKTYLWIEGGEAQMNKFKKKLFRFTKALLSAATVVTMFASGFTGTGVTQVSAAGSAFKTTGDHSGMISAGKTVLGAPYSTSVRQGPSYDCSGFVNMCANWSGMGTQPSEEAWITNNWHDYLMAAGVDYTDGSQDSLPSLLAGKGNPGDIILFYNGGYTAGNTVHMALLVNNNLMLGAIYGGVQFTAFSGTATYDGKTYGHYVGEGNKTFDHVRVFHFSTDKDVNVSFTKTSANVALTSDNSNYSLAGAVYGVYTDSGCTNKVGEIATGASGTGSATVTVEPTQSTLYFKELTAPKGFEINAAVISASISGESCSASASDKSANDPLAIKLFKISNDPVEDPASLENAEFTIKYYDVDPGSYTTAASVASLSPKRTWVIKTIKDAIGNYMTMLDDNHKVSGDDFYYSEGGIPTLPVGVITVQETKAPEGYLLEGATLGNESISADENGFVYFAIEQQGNGGVGVLRGGNEYSVSDKTIRTGNFEFQKYDAETGLTTPQGDANIGGGEYTVINRNDYHVYVDGNDIAPNANAYTFVTDESGKYSSDEITFPYGKYEIIETKAPKGYTQYPNYDADRTPTHYSFTVTENGQEIKLINKELSDVVIRGGFEILKKDKHLNTNRAEGEGSLSATFELVNKSKNSVRVNGTDFEPNARIMTFQTAEDGSYKTADDLLPYGTYEVNEIQAPIGYTLTGSNINVTFSVEEEHKISDLTDAIKDNPIVGQVEILKTIVNDLEDSEFSRPEINAKFAVVLKKYVEQYGSVDEALNHTDEMTDLEFDVLTTGENGSACSHDLAYGHYVIKQIASGDPELKIIEETCEDFVVSYENQPVFHLDANNKPETYYIEIVKNDKDTAKRITLNSATFRIKNTDTGEYVSQRVGMISYDKFKTVSDNEGIFHGVSVYYAGEEEKGTVTTPLKLKAGNYQIEELEDGTPWSFLTHDPIPFTVTASSYSTIDSEGILIKVIDVDNDRAYGELVIHKTVEDYSSDTTFIDRTDLSSIEFTLKTAGDIINPDDGSILYKAGDVYGVYNLNKDGSLDVKKIPLGKYTLQETAVPDGMILDETVHEIVFEQTDFTTSVYKQEISVENRTTKIELSKKTATGDDELPGATIEVRDSKGNTVDTWVSGDHAHIIEGLKLGETYTMTETITPKDENGEDLGYAKSTSIEFTVNEDGTVKTVTMIDKVVTMTKQDMGGDEVPGAAMKVTDSEGKTVDEWTSSDTPHKIRNLEVGKTYVLHEDTAPAGYAKATDIEFTVEDDGIDQTVKMVDKIITLTKEDGGNGEEVPGAHIQIIDENDVVIDEWDSTDEPHQIKNLEVGKTYTMHETQTPDGYYYAVDGKFTVTDDGMDQVEKMIDNPIIYEILKVDDKTGEPVEGVELQLIDRTLGEEVTGSPWTTTLEPIVLDRVLIAGHDYELIESEWVAGVHKSTSITFAVGLTGNAEKKAITMVDLVNAISFLKVNPEGKPLSGATLQILAAATDDEGMIVPAVDENGDEIVITSFTTTNDPKGVSVDDNGVEIATLLKGDVLEDSSDEETLTEESTFKDPIYILREVAAPFGYELAEDIVFTVSGTLDHPQMIQMTDERKTFYVSVDKVDADDHSKKLSGAEITIFNAKTNEVAKTVQGKDAIAVTNKNGNVVFEMQYLEDGYYAKETKAPENYKLNKNSFKVKLSEDYDFAKENPVKITVTDKEKPVDTGVAGPIGISTVGCGAAVAALCLLNRKKKQEETETE